MPRLSLVPRDEPFDPAPVQVAQRSAPPAPAPAAPVFEAPAPIFEAAATVLVSPEYHFVHDRVTAIERLTRLRERGALSDEEYASEKAIVLALPADELVLHAPSPDEPLFAQPARRVQGPSLLGRLLDWRIVSFALAAGLGLSYATQPQETLRFFDEALRLFGA